MGVIYTCQNVERLKLRFLAYAKQRKIMMIFISDDQRIIYDEELKVLQSRINII